MSENKNDNMNDNNNRDKKNKIRVAAILSGGESTRLQQVTRFKALAQIAGESLINRLVKELLALGIERIVVALNFNMQSLDFENDERLAVFKLPQVSRIFVSTPSSMHTLYQIYKYLYANYSSASSASPQDFSHLFVSMVDTIVRSDELKGFYRSACELLTPEQSMILTTKYIDDEKPLTVDVDGQFVSAFAIPVESATLVTSGLYCFSSSVVYPLLETSINSGQEKLRNFLAQIIKSNYAIKNYTIDKTIDVDRPEDLVLAQRFIE
ncbi:MAG: NTP transferase domain-containing protein [Oligoflexia bacterium]|nr:NTP transferase domain-containing protein [Oligoflexia bacterium]